MGQLVYIPFAAGSGGVSAPSDLYLATTGNDANDGLTPGTAVATVAALWALLPIGTPIDTIVHVHIASGTYTYSNPPANLSFAPSGGLVMQGDGAGQGGDDGFTELYTGVLTGGSSGAPPASIVTDGAAAFVTDEWIGKTLTMVDGPGAGRFRMLTGNTATVLTYSYQSIGAAIGNTYRILEPGVIFDALALPEAVFPGPFCPLNIRVDGNVKFKDRVYALGLEILSSRTLGVYDGNLGGRSIITGAAFNASWSVVPPAGELETYVNALFSGVTDVDGWGISSWDAAIVFNASRFLFNDWDFFGTWAGFASNVNSMHTLIGGCMSALAMHGGAVYRLDGVRLKGNTIIGLRIFEGSKIYTPDAYPSSFELPATINFIRGAEISAIIAPITVSLSGSASLDIASTVIGGDAQSSTGPMTINNAGTGAVTIRDNSRVQLANSTFTSTGALVVEKNSDLDLTGSFTTASAITVRKNSRALFNAITSTSTLLVQDKSEVVLNSGAVTFTAAGEVVTVSRGSSLVQTTGATLSVTSTSSNAIVAEKRSEIVLRGGGSTTTAATLAGVVARSGSQVWFDSSPTSIGGAAAAQLQVGVLAAQDVVGLTGAAAGAFITDTPTGASVGTGGASVIGRAA